MTVSMIDPTGKTAVVAGGFSSIGLVTVELLSEADAAVASYGRNTGRLIQTEQGLRSRFLNARLSVVTCDVLDAAQMAVFIDVVEQAMGPVDMLVNNAGQGRVSTFADTGNIAWTQELYLKFFSMIHPTRASMSQLECLTHGTIVCADSPLAQQPESHMVATSAVRAGVLNLVRPMAIESAPKGARVNDILIGLVGSGQWRHRFEARPEENRHLDWAAWMRRLAARRHIPLGRLGLPEEAVHAILFLASPLSLYTTGSHIGISGRHSRHA